jgi:aryl-alcohol dehydrogenase-like predicted oxidoreductase
MMGKGEPMSEKESKDSRRTFLKAAGAIGAGSIIATLAPFVNASDKGGSKRIAPVTVPTRPLGKTGVNVSILSLGGVLGMSDLLIFRQAIKMGVTYWDTADSYGGGKNEKAIGKYFAKFPNDRKRVFLVTKAATSDPKKLTEKLNTSLQRMNTSYIDMYFIHYVKDVKDKLTGEVKAWAEKTKAEGKIRFFGFSAHKNMENSMLEAAKLGWIDGIMMSYNYRLMVKDEMKRAVDACVKAGIGLTAMKTQAAFSAHFYSSIGFETDDALNMTESFICSAMSNMTILQANVAAALNKNELSSRDKQLFEHYARKTAPGYCAGCADICEPAVDFKVPISDVLRCSMYYDSYGDRDKALALFNALPTDQKRNIGKTDYSKAERKCPQKIEIGKVLKKIYADLT